MIRINRETDYGIAILGLMAQAPGERYSASGIATQHNLPQPVVSKILKRLNREGLLHSYRGAKGGYGLARAPAVITVEEIITALEGPIELTACAEDGSEVCQCGNHCHVSENWSRINRAVRRALEGITLAEMSAPGAVDGDAVAARAVHPLAFTGVRYGSDD